MYAVPRSFREHLKTGTVKCLWWRLAKSINKYENKTKVRPSRCYPWQHSSELASPTVCAAIQNRLRYHPLKGLARRQMKSNVKPVRAKKSHVFCSRRVLEDGLSVSHVHFFLFPSVWGASLLFGESTSRIRTKNIISTICNCTLESRDLTRWKSSALSRILCTCMCKYAANHSMMPRNLKTAWKLQVWERAPLFIRWKRT